MQRGRKRERQKRERERGRDRERIYKIDEDDSREVKRRQRKCLYRKAITQDYKYSR